MQGSYDPFLVALSVVVATFASYTALSMASRLHASRAVARLVWFICGSVAMGVGIWSMHFIGMLALKMPVPLAYDVPITALSLLLAVAVSAIALILGVRKRPSWTSTFVGALAMGLGIVSMHYSGMAAVLVAPAIEYDTTLFIASCVVAFVASFAALGILYRLRGARQRKAYVLRAGAAVLMGLAISGMHYTGMAAAHFAPDIICTVAAPEISANWLATAIGTTTFAVLGLAIVSAIVDSHMVSKAQRYNESLSLANASLREANDELARLANHDVLTGLPNRTLLTRRIEETIHQGAPFAVIFIDLDRFKYINDSLGHHVGDQLLKAVARRLSQASVSSNVVARIGGDEFVVLCREPGGSPAAVERAQMLRGALLEGFSIDGRELHVTATLGISLHPTDGDSAEALLVNADAAMYFGKQSGRDSFRLFEPAMSSFAQERMDIESGLRRALKNDEFELHFQPKVDVLSGVVVAHEALVRWRCPTRGLVRPDLFISIAEEAGLIGALGEWVLRAACMQNKAWQDQGFRPMSMAVNISAKQFQQADLYALVSSVLEESQLSPEYLELELTESAFMVEPENTAKVLRRIGALGVNISIDDFGTGYSSLAYLRDLPLNKLKIDRAFIQGLTDNGKDASIVKAIVSMAHSLKLEVIAEGVETVDQLAVLKSLRCDQFQGYLFSPPGLPDKVANYIPRQTVAAAAQVS